MPGDENSVAFDIAELNIANGARRITYDNCGPRNVTARRIRDLAIRTLDNANREPRTCQKMTVIDDAIFRSVGLQANARVLKDAILKSAPALVPERNELVFALKKTTVAAIDSRMFE